MKLKSGFGVKNGMPNDRRRLELQLLLCFRLRSLHAFLAVAWALPLTSALADFFVSPTGTDTNPGTKAQPFASLEAARDAVRKLKSDSGLPAGGITVWLRGGDYLRTNALELTTADSGTPAAPIIWRAYKDEAPRLLGGVRLDRVGRESAQAQTDAGPQGKSGLDGVSPHPTLAGFQPVTDPAVLARLDEKARGHVVQVDLRALGIRDFGEMKSRGFGRPTTPAHCELFFAGKPMTLARWPNEGEFAQIAGFPDAAGQGDEHGGKIGKLEDGFTYAGDRPRRWKDTSDLWVHGYWAYDWANSYERVTSLNLDRRLVKTAPPYGQYGFRKGQRFYFLNVLEEIDQPGEWFLDRKTGVLYFWPPVAADVSPRQTSSSVAVDVSPQQTSDAPARRALTSTATPEVVLSLLAQPLLKLTDISHVTFRGLILDATRGNAVEIRGGEGNRIAGCVIRNIGDYGVKIEGGTGHGVSGCDVFDTGDGGVEMSGGDRQTLAPGGHFVEDCHFARQGRWSKCYVPAIHMLGVGQRASHNLIHDHPHCAILFGGNDHLIEFNEIHHIALETGDVGAIYTGRDYTYRGNRIRFNFIHHTGGVGMGSMGVYMDDCVSGTEVFGNLFYKVHWAMFIGGGRDHRVENNVFVDCDPAVRMDGRGLDKSPVWFNMVNDYMRRRLAEMPAALYRECYPAIRTLDACYGPPGGPAIVGDAFKGVPPEGNVVARNVCAGKWLEVGWHATEAMLHLENNLTNAAPSLVRLPGDDARPGDFALKADSPAWKLGFERIPLDQIGLRDSEFRRDLARLTNRN